MLTDAHASALGAAWQPARTAGVLGPASIEELWEHTAGYASAVCSAFSAGCSTWNGSIIDVGTGAGVPGALLAVQLPHAELTLVDASERRLDHARAAVRALDVSSRTAIVHARADDLARDSAHRGRYDVAVARLLADPAESLEQLAPLVRPAGIVVLSMADADVNRWADVQLSDLGDPEVEILEGARGSLVCVRIRGAAAMRYPRRVSVRRRAPLF